ncbi:MAG TPA: ABC transporter ATP-binding protein [Chromatiales bacterium]|nr:ABC transporter ATP-binding protein [Chromatiales bacterium]
MSDPLLQVRDLDVRFTTPDGPVHAVRELNFEIAAGEVLGIVGESGSGKSQSALALLGLLADNGRATGRALFEGQDLLALPEHRLEQIRGAGIAMVFQDPMTSLNPYLSIGRQMMLVLRRHQQLSRRAARKRCEQALEAVSITEPRRRLGMYPHELSGGQRQRVMIAIALACRPKLLIADEPTTALDVTVQAQILDLLKRLRDEYRTAIMLITHDLGVVAGQCDRVLVMQDGQQRDYGDVDRIFHAPAHPYTHDLLAAVPRLDTVPERPEPRRTQTLIGVDDLQVRFAVERDSLFGPRRELRAVDRVSFEIASGETLGVVGESGCGKSTLARAVLRLVDVQGGHVALLGRDLLALAGEPLRDARRDLQAVFQDPFASLDPRMTIRDIVAEPLQSFRPELGADDVTRAVAQMLERVGLDAAAMYRYPHQFSGGQCQRIGIARALVSGPKLVICDEPVSALDVSVQARIIELLIELQQALDLALIFIAHDLAVVRQISHRVMVMYLGRAVEIADNRTLYEQPAHPYTRALLEAVPVPDPRIERRRTKRPLTGDVPSPLEPPSGCAFRSRCRFAVEACALERPQLRPVGRSQVACLRAGQLGAVATETGQQ